MMSAIVNPAYVGDDGHGASYDVSFHNNNEKEKPIDTPQMRTKWGKDIEFLFSCIALSVGFGNLWRFPFTALENGGGAFVIPYLIVLFLIGRPVYYLEMLMGQFSSRGCINVYDISPAMRGLGYGQTFATFVVMTFYTALMAITVRYLITSFSDPLPWSDCDAQWGTTCLNSSFVGDTVGNMTILRNGTRSSAEFYFSKVVLKETASIHDGLGTPDWKLVLCLAFSWICIALILIKGVESSGKASYFLAIFPYVIMLILLIRACTLPGALKGILFFIEPQWGKLLDGKVWYEAVTQVFFSLAICFGQVVVYSSYNRFSNNIYRDAMIVTWLDTFTSMVSGCIVFGVVGNLAHVTNTTDIRSVTKGGPGLSFITYPDAISKFTFLPQAFSVLFFLMLFVLGIGSNIGIASTVITAIKDQFPKLKNEWVVAAVTVVAFFIGLIYTTPGGLFMLDLFDHYGVTFVALSLACFELITFAWIYGVNRICKDIEFMMGIKTGLYWRICWSIITPGLMLIIFIYSIADYKPKEHNGYVYPDSAYALGWIIYTIGVVQLPAWAIYAILKRPEDSWKDKIINAFKPTTNWGPEDRELNIKYNIMISQSNLNLPPETSFVKKIIHTIFS